MKLSFEYKGIKVTYYLTYKKAKAISIKITEEGHVNVMAPIGTPVFTVMDKVKGNAPWIINELYRKAVTNGNDGVHPEVSNEEVKLLDQYMYSGKNYKLEVVSNAEAEEIKVKMVRGKFVVETATEDTSEIRSAIVKWYKQKVKSKIIERTKQYKDVFENIPNEISLTDNNILFEVDSTHIAANARLGMLPSDVFDYILISSLCHVNCEDKESEMKQLAELLPKYEKSVEWLEENKNKLYL